MQENIFDNNENNFNIPSDVLDEIQANIENIIQSFDIPDANKTDVIKKINFMYKQTKHISLTDALTGLYNRRYFETSFEREFSRARRYANDLSFAIIDIDFFKKINDTYGHSCGDYVLKEVAYLISNNFRITDMFFRYGGEEFIFLLPHTNLSEAEIVAQRLKNAVENKKINIEEYNIKDIKEISVTISIGVSQYNKTDKDPQMLYKKADSALYEAKETGRNKVVIYEEK